MRSLIGRWWYVRSETHVCVENGLAPFDLWKPITIAARLHNMASVRRAKGRMRTQGHTNVRAHRVSIWRKASVEALDRVMRFVASGAARNKVSITRLDGFRKQSLVDARCEAMRKGLIAFDKRNGYSLTDKRTAWLEARPMVKVDPQ